jgi:hypothetical protein
MRILDSIRNWGSTPDERARPFACDDFLTSPDDVLFRAISIDAPAAVVYRWLGQLRVAPYSYDWLDNFGRRSPRKLTPGLGELAVGDRVMTIFRVTAFEADRQVTVVLDLPHVPKALAGEGAVTYEAIPVSDGRCRLVVKLLLRYPPGPGQAARWFLPAADLVMMRKQLLTLKQLAEA